jgi:uncharacterized C2H2 Zn-finger protein
LGVYQSDFLWVRHTVPTDPIHFFSNVPIPGTGCGKLLQRMSDSLRHVKKCKLKHIHAQREKIKLDVNEIAAETNLQCKVCSVFFARKGLLISHMNSAHRGIRYKCTGCDKSHKRKSDCLRHISKCRLQNISAKMEQIKLDENEIEASLQCPFCSLFYHGNSLNSHIASVHNKHIKYKCTGCGKVYKRKEDCLKHIKKCKLSNINADMEKFESDVFIETPDIMKISYTEKMVNFPNKESMSPAPKKSRIEEFPSKNLIFSLNENSCKEETFSIRANISQTETCPYKEIIDPAPENTRIEKFPSKKSTVNTSISVKEVLEEKQRIQCQFCQLFYGKQNSLNVHINYVHNGIRFKCTGCDKSHKRKGDCVKHIKKCKLVNIDAEMEKIKLGDYEERTAIKIEINDS